jgi:hypothetical protein
MWHSVLIKLFYYRLSINKNLDSIRFALFVACMNAIYKAVLCFLRRFIKDDKKNALIAGFMSALSLLIDTKDRRIFIALIIFSRSLVSNIRIE